MSGPPLWGVRSVERDRGVAVGPVGQEYQTGRSGRFGSLPPLVHENPIRAEDAVPRGRLHPALSRVAVVRLSPALVRRLPDLSDATLVDTVVGVAPDADGWTTVDLPIEHDEVAARQLLPHAGDLEVVSPTSLRVLLMEQARAVVAMYA